MDNNENKKKEIDLGENQKDSKDSKELLSEISSHLNTIKNVLLYFMILSWAGIIAWLILSGVLRSSRF